jgi:excisionase family DNA binding protein
MSPNDNLRSQYALKVREVAERLRVKPDAILAWIRRGELRALDVSQSRGLKPRWRILPGDLAAFEASRMATPPPKPVRRNRHDPAVVEFY